MKKCILWLCLISVVSIGWATNEVHIDNPLNVFYPIDVQISLSPDQESYPDSAVIEISFQAKLLTDHPDYDSTRTYHIITNFDERRKNYLRSMISQIVLKSIPELVVLDAAHPEYTAALQLQFGGLAKPFAASFPIYRIAQKNHEIRFDNQYDAMIIYSISKHIEYDRSRFESQPIPALPPECDPEICLGDTIPPRGWPRLKSHPAVRLSSSYTPKKDFYEIGDKITVHFRAEFDKNNITYDSKREYILWHDLYEMSRQFTIQELTLGDFVIMNHEKGFIEETFIIEIQKECDSEFYINFFCMRKAKDQTHYIWLYPPIHHETGTV